jgi:hypothetical protein
MAGLFQALDSGAENAFAPLRDLLNRRKYIDNLIQQVEGALAS